MNLTLIKKFENGSEKKLFTIGQKEMDEFTILNFQDELDMELYFSNVSIDNAVIGRFLLASIKDGKRMEFKMFYGSDYDQFKEKLDSGVLDDDRFKEKVREHCPNLSIDDLTKTTIVKNFRELYYILREYSIERLEGEKILKK